MWKNTFWRVKIKQREAEAESLLLLLLCRLWSWLLLLLLLLTLTMYLSLGHKPQSHTRMYMASEQMETFWFSQHYFHWFLSWMFVIFISYTLNHNIKTSSLPCFISNLLHEAIYLSLPRKLNNKLNLFVIK